MSPKLLLREHPEPDESLTGYLIRLATLNGYEGPKWILSIAGVDKSQSKWDRPSFVFNYSNELEGLRELIGLQPRDLSTMLYSRPNETEPTPNDYMFFGTSVPGCLIVPGICKVCPLCLEEAPYCRRIWDFKLVTCCPLHKVLLIDQCQYCKKQIGWNRPTVVICNCGFDLRRICTTHVSAYRLTGVFYRLCDLKDGPKSGYLSKLGPLSGIGLKHIVLAILFVISGLKRDPIMSINAEGMSALSNIETYNLLRHAAWIFEGWPDRFYELMNFWWPPSINHCRSIVRQRFRDFFHTFFWDRRLSHPDLNFLRMEVANYFGRSGEADFARRLRAKPTELTITEVAEGLDIDKDSMEQIINGQLQTQLPGAYEVMKEYASALRYRLGLEN